MIMFLFSFNLFCLLLFVLLCFFVLDPLKSNKLHLAILNNYNIDICLHFILQKIDPKLIFTSSYRTRFLYKKCPIS
jgi:hypothetical protein